MTSALRRPFVLALIATTALLPLGCEDGPDGSVLTFAVKRGSFEAVVESRGSLAPQQEVNVLAKQSGTITKMMRDGAIVKEGDIVVEQDTSDTDREIMDATNELSVMQAQLVSRLADLSNRKNKARAQSDEAERNLQLAKIEHENMIGGAYIDPATRIAAKEGAAQAKATAKARAEDLGVLSKLKGSGVIPEDEFRDLHKDVKMLEAGVREAAATFDKVLEGAEPGEVVEARLDIKVKEYRYKISNQWLEDLERQEKEIVKRSRERIRRQKLRITRLDEKLAKLTLRAPTGGVLLVKSFWGRKIGPGRRIWRGVPACSIANTDSMLVTIKVGGREQRLLKRDQLAAVFVDALGDVPIKARVRRVGRFGRDAFYHLDARTKELVGDANRRVYDVLVILEEPAKGLLPGLMATVRVKTAVEKDVIAVPRELVRNRAEERGTVRLLTDGGVVERQVRLGTENRSMVVVTDGLVAGDRIVIGE